MAANAATTRLYCYGYEVNVPSYHADIKLRSMSFTVPRKDRPRARDDFHSLWYEVAGGVYRTSLVNPKFWDRWRLADDFLDPRRWDSIGGRKKPTIIQLDENVIEDIGRWPVYAYPRLYAREWHVVDWSGIETGSSVRQYFYGMALRYGDDWFESDKEEIDVMGPLPSGDRNVYRIGPPPWF